MSAMPDPWTRFWELIFNAAAALDQVEAEREKAKSLVTPPESGTRKKAPRC